MSSVGCISSSTGGEAKAVLAVPTFPKSAIGRALLDPLPKQRPPPPPPLPPPQQVAARSRARSMRGRRTARRTLGPGTWDGAVGNANLELLGCSCWDLGWSCWSSTCFWWPRSSTNQNPACMEDLGPYVRTDFVRSCWLLR